MYAYDLIWGITKQYYEDLPRPSEVWQDRKPTDTRSVEQIKNDLMKRLEGE